MVKKKIPYVEGIKYKAKLSHPIAKLTTVHYFMCSHLTILSICEHSLCLLLVLTEVD